MEQPWLISNYGFRKWCSNMGQCLEAWRLTNWNNFCSIVQRLCCYTSNIAYNKTKWLILWHLTFFDTPKPICRCEKCGETTSLQNEVAIFPHPYKNHVSEDVTFLYSYIYIYDFYGDMERQQSHWYGKCGVAAFLQPYWYIFLWG